MESADDSTLHADVFLQRLHPPIDATKIASTVLRPDAMNNSELHSSASMPITSNAHVPFLDCLHCFWIVMITAWWILGVTFQSGKVLRRQSAVVDLTTFNDLRR